MATSHEVVANLYGKTVDIGYPRDQTYCARKRIADVGGGPGILAFALADEGHYVDLIDLSPNLIRVAEAEQQRRSAADDNQALLASIGVGNALDRTALASDSYDAVLLLGPLYHLLEVTERKEAVENALRLARPNEGIVFCAFVSMEAHLRDIALRDPARLAERGTFMLPMSLADGWYQKFNETLATEVQSFHTNSRDIRQFFQCHFADTAELIGLRSTEGILGGGLDTKLTDANSEIVKIWADLMFEEYSWKEEHLGCADHLLAVLRRK